MQVHHTPPIPTTTESDLRLHAIITLLHKSERAGKRISTEVQQILENQCSAIFKCRNTSCTPRDFSTVLKNTAVRMFRQRRYREADRRYRMASLFNPDDVTLLSNRATCMYNLHRYRRCIDLCMHCISAFPQLFTDNPQLYFKIALRIGRAHIELCNFADARLAAQALISMRANLAQNFNIKLTDADFNAMIVPFRSHLDAAISKFQYLNPGKPIPTERTSRSATFLGTDGFVHQDDTYDPSDESDDDSHYSESSIDNDDPQDREYHALDYRPNTSRLVTMADLCPHINPTSTARCDHDRDHVRPANRDLNRPSGLALNMDRDTNPVQGNVFPHMPNQLQDVTSTMTNDEYHAQHVADNSSVQAISESIMRSRVTSTSFDWNSPRRTETTKETSKSGWEIPPYMDDSVSALFIKRWDGQYRPKISTSEPMSISDRGEPVIISTSPAPTRSSSKMTKISYESDGDKFESRQQMFEDENHSNKAAMSVYKHFASLDKSSDHDILSETFCEVFGESFEASRLLDFSSLFGGHLREEASTKRDKGKCGKNCGQCFARRMWSMRFISHDESEARAYIQATTNDSRKNPSSYLAEHLWDGTGYFGSGFELSFDVPALVHGVAFLAILQSELHWRGDHVPNLNDVQRNFIAVLESNIVDQQSLTCVSSMFYMLRETLNLFEVFVDCEARGIERSFQFAYTASCVAKAGWGTRAGGETNTFDRSASLMTRSENSYQNMYNWGVLGNISKEEHQVYRTLTRNISDLLITITTGHVPNPTGVEYDCYASKLIADFDEDLDDSPCWEKRVVCQLGRNRCRRIEKTGAVFLEEMEKRELTSAEFEQSDQLLSRAIGNRFKQPRLFYKRAKLRHSAKRSRQALEDLHEAQRIIKEKDIDETISFLDDKSCLLLLHIYMLEAEIWMQQSHLPSMDSLSCLGAAISCYRKAVDVNPRGKKTKTQLLRKLRALELEETKALSSSSSSRRASYSRDKQRGIFSGATSDAVEEEYATAPHSILLEVSAGNDRETSQTTQPDEKLDLTSTKAKSNPRNGPEKSPYGVSVTSNGEKRALFFKGNSSATRSNSELPSANSKNSSVILSTGCSSVSKSAAEGSETGVESCMDVLTVGKQDVNESLEVTTSDESPLQKVADEKSSSAKASTTLKLPRNGSNVSNYLVQPTSLDISKTTSLSIHDVKHSKSKVNVYPAGPSTRPTNNVIAFSSSGTDPKSTSISSKHNMKLRSDVSEPLVMEPVTPAGFGETSSSEEDNTVCSLSDNPFGILGNERAASAAEEGTAASKTGNTSGKGGTSSYSTSKKASRHQLSNLTGVETIVSVATGLKCNVCDICFTNNQRDYNNHMKGKRHHAAVARAQRIAEQVKEAKTKAQKEEPAGPAGPTAQDVANEVKSIIMNHGGEAYMTQISDALDLSRWGIVNAESFIVKKFGGITNACLDLCKGFETRAGTQANPVLVITSDMDFVSVSKRRQPGPSNLTDAYSRPHRGLHRSPSLKRHYKPASSPEQLQARLMRSAGQHRLARPSRHPIGNRQPSSGRLPDSRSLNRQFNVPVAQQPRHMRPDNGGPSWLRAVAPNAGPSSMHWRGAWLPEQNQAPSDVAGHHSQLLMGSSPQRQYLTSTVRPPEIYGPQMSAMPSMSTAAASGPTWPSVLGLGGVVGGGYGASPSGYGIVAGAADTDMTSGDREQERELTKAMNDLLTLAEVTQPDKLKTEVNDEEDTECKICLDQNADMRLVPCGHCWCEPCVMANFTRERFDCPYCRTPISHVEHLSLD